MASESKASTPVDNARIERLRAITTASLSDVLDNNGIVGVMNGLQRRSGRGRSVGRARTIACETANFGDFDEGAFAVFPIFNSTRPNDLLVFDLGGADVSTFGGLAGLTVSRLGAAGVLIDGACRDVEELRDIGVTVASRHLTPRSGRGRMRILSRDEPITCGGVTVNPDDFIVIDDTGIIVIPEGLVDEILQQAEAIEARDTSLAQQTLA